MALRIKSTPVLPRSGGAIMFSGIPTLTAYLDGEGTLTLPSQIARVEFIDISFGMYRLLPDEEMVSPNEVGANWRVTTHKGKFPSAVRTQTQQDRTGEWDYRYATWHEWGRPVDVAVVAYNVLGVELARARLGAGRIANYGGYALPTQVIVGGVVYTGDDVETALRRPVYGIITLVCRMRRVDHITNKDAEVGGNDLSAYLSTHGGGVAQIFSAPYIDDVLLPDHVNPLLKVPPAGATPPVLLPEQVLEPAFSSPTYSRVGAGEAVFYIDTRRYANGKHRCRIFGQTTEPRPVNRHHVKVLPADFTQVDLNDMADDLPVCVEFDLNCQNGHAPLGIIPSKRDLWLVPGESASISCEMLFTDGTREAIPTAKLRIRGEGKLRLGDNSVWRDGRDIATTNGTDTITASSTVGLDARTFFTVELKEYDDVFWHPPRKAEILVRVRPSVPAALPHFRHGTGPSKIYDAVESFFPVNYFQLDIAAFTGREAAMVAECARVGINALNTGVFLSGRSTPGITYDAWVAAWEAWIADRLAFFERNPGLKIYGAADDIGRARIDLKWTNDTPWVLNPPDEPPDPDRPSALTYAMQRLLDAGVIIAVDVFDEASGLFVGGPVAPVGEMWSQNNLVYGPGTGFDGLPNTEDIRGSIVQEISDALRATTGGEVPISFPILGAGHPHAAWSWMGPGSTVSTFGSVFWTSWDRPRPDYNPLAQTRYDMETSALRWETSLDRPNVLQISVAGSFYHKMTAGDHFRPGYDFSIIRTYIGAHKDSMPVAIWLAVAEGYAGIRVYFYENDNQITNPRYSKTLPYFGEVQTGASEKWQSHLWEAMGNALRLVHELKDLVLMPNVSSPFVHHDLTVAMKTGANGKMLVVINWSDYALTVPTGQLALAGYIGGTLVRLLNEQRTNVAFGAAPTEWTIPPHEVWVLYKR